MIMIWQGFFTSYYLSSAAAQWVQAALVCWKMDGTATGTNVTAEAQYKRLHTIKALAGNFFGLVLWFDNQ